MAAHDRAVELGVAEREDTSVCSCDPVSTAVGSHSDADYGAFRLTGCRAVERHGAECEYAAIGGCKVVAAPIARTGYSDNRLVQVNTAHRAVKNGMSKREHAAIGGRQVVTLSSPGRRLREGYRRGLHRPEEERGREDHAKRPPTCIPHTTHNVTSAFTVAPSYPFDGGQ